jgi:AcrR family transcriptional regulator
MTETSFDSSSVIAAALRLAAERGWSRLTLRDIAAAAGLPAETVQRHFPCKTAVLLAYAKEIERRAAASPVPFEAEDTVRDRLFELLMQRIDLLSPEKDAVVRILRDLPADPLGATVATPEVLRLMASILELAGVSAAGPIGWLRCKGLAGIWLATLCAWARDDSPDHARTMAALDSYLRRIEPAARLLSGPFTGRRPDAAPGGF